MFKGPQNACVGVVEAGLVNGQESTLVCEQSLFEMFISRPPYISLKSHNSLLSRIDPR